MLEDVRHFVDRKTTSQIEKDRNKNAPATSLDGMMSEIAPQRDSIVMVVVVLVVV